MKKSIPIIVGLLAFGMVFASFTRASALSPPSWVPTTVSGWTLGYQGPLNNTGLEINSSAIKVVSNWTQVWYQGASSSVDGIVGVVAMQYDQDYFSKQLSPTVKTALQLLNSTFTGTTVWDALAYFMSYIGPVTDEKANIAGASGAISVNLTWGLGASFYLLYAYAGPKAMCIFGMFVNSTFIDDVNANLTDSIYTYIRPYFSLISTAFGSFLTIFAELGISSMQPAAEIAPATSAGTPTSTSVVKTFASSYVQQVAASNGGATPGYAVGIVGAMTAIAVFLIVRKKKMAVV
ncbi:MAG TPA: hypothetical protein VKM55_04865 [Candidatus Lokiarchaeia archaeon]|nr:hypothetical protein [Candidatus Lokiarchaeia archaeon]